MTVRRGKVVLVDSLELRAPGGSMLAISGAAGSGKSSVLSGIAGPVPGATGAVSLHGVPLGDERLTQRVGVVSQTHELVPTLTARENVTLAALADGTVAGDAWAYAGELLGRLDLSTAAQANLAEELSGGQHQRVAVARALAGQPALIIADDPTSELDAANVERVAGLLRAAVSAGAVVVVATNDPVLVGCAETTVHLGDVAAPGHGHPDRGDVEHRSEAAPGGEADHPVRVRFAHDPSGPGARLVPAAVVDVSRERTAQLPGCVRVSAGWVPRHCLALAPGRRGADRTPAVVLLPYDTTELATEPGDQLWVLRREPRSGWTVCRDGHGTVGRVPSASLSPMQSETADGTRPSAISARGSWRAAWRR